MQRNAAWATTKANVGTSSCIMHEFGLAGTLNWKPGFHPAWPLSYALKWRPQGCLRPLYLPFSLINHTVCCPFSVFALSSTVVRSVSGCLVPLIKSLEFFAAFLTNLLLICCYELQPALEKTKNLTSCQRYATTLPSAVSEFQENPTANTGKCTGRQIEQR